MQRILDTVSPLRTMRRSRTMKRFYIEQAGRGVQMRDIDVPALLCDAQTVMIDAALVMEGWNAVRMVAAPLSVCSIDRFKRQGSWMMLTAGVALGCEGYAPLQEFAKKMSFERSRMMRQYPQIEAIAYDDHRKIETTLHRDANRIRAFAKGEPEAVLERCAYVLDGKERPLIHSDRKLVLEAMEEMERTGLVTLAFATKRQEQTEDIEKDMVFLGIVGMGDLPAAEAPDHIELFRSMNIRPVLISRDHLSEGAVRLSGILRANAGMMYASEAQQMEEDTLKRMTASVDAYIGFSNAQRRRVLRAMRANQTVPLVVPSPEGGIAITTGAEEDDVVLNHGGLKAVAKIFQECYAALKEE